MGTGVISIAGAAFQFVLPFAPTLQIFFLIIALLFFVSALIPWTLRWFLYFEDVRRDLNHPVLAAFFPTMPISLIVIGIALEKTGNRLLPESALWSILQVLWLLGAAGILFFALVILNIFLHKPEIEWQASTLGWLIPPVSALIVPVLGGSLSLHFYGTAWGELNLLVSLVFLGIGSFLFVFVMAVVLTRYIFYALPPAHLAPTMWVGIVPTSILTILSIRLVKPISQFFQAGPETEQLLALLARPTGVILWGFAAFWLSLALVVTLEIWRKSNIPFALSWWAFIFPLGAFATASGVLYQAIPAKLFLWTGLLALAGVIALWAGVTFRTAQGILSGTIFKPHGGSK
ncbi:MAG: hypothetical protein DDG60_04655 [Anaerolineae bacterium]|nr:MAG: hypothetical protein DDG60_04655 [Anaerolineae bacterium]